MPPRSKSPKTRTVAAAEPLSLPDPAPEAGGPSGLLPEPVALSYDAVRVDVAGAVLKLNDTHIPYHDKPTIEAAVGEGRRRGAKVVFLNGDILDCGEISDHYKHPSEPRLVEELEKGTQFFAWLRGQFPRARIIYKAGNHEERLPRYLARGVPALCTSKHVQLPTLLGLDQFGVEFVCDGVPVHLGKLPVYHGHEFAGSGGEIPARWLFNKTLSSAMCGHLHRSGEHFVTGADRRVHGTWTVGCACHLHPKWLRENRWNHGYAIVDVARDGGFEVLNRKRLRDGRVV